MCDRALLIDYPQRKIFNPAARSLTIVTNNRTVVEWSAGISGEARNWGERVSRSGRLNQAAQVVILTVIALVVRIRYAERQSRETVADGRRGMSQNISDGGC